MPARSRSNEFSITRVYDAPVAAVWDAWTDPEQVAQWWGPRGFTLTTHSKDLRPGGSWVYTMHGPDGTDWPNKTLYYEVEEHRKLVYDHGGNDDRPPIFRVTVLFSELADGKTQMAMTFACASPEAAQETLKFIKKASGNSTWDRLAEYLEKQSSGKEQFVINRTFDAPIDVVFEVWTQPEHFSKWLPPTGFGLEFIRADIRPGGTALVRIANDVMSFCARFEYLCIDRPEYVAYTQQFCDEQGNLTQHPAMPSFPATLLTTVRLAVESPEQTRVTVTSQPYGEVTREELEAFIRERGGMTMGWTGSFDALEEYLQSR